MVANEQGTIDPAAALDRIGAAEARSKRTIAYLASHYARADDTFIRSEVEQLRKLGFIIKTFSVRQPRENELVSDSIRFERNATEDLLRAGPIRLSFSAFFFVIMNPFRLMRTLPVAIRLGTPGFRGRLLPLAYLLEACFLAQRLKKHGVEHLHNHSGFNSAAIAMLASALTDIPYSLTIHGPTEFDQPMMLSLNEKIARSMFTVSISELGRSQLMRWCASEHWIKIHIVRCGLLSEFRLEITTSVPDVSRILYTARLVKDKGHLLLIKAIARLVKQGVTVQLDLIGDGPFRAEIQQAIIRFGLESHVRLLGYRASNEVREALGLCRGYVSPSLAEGLPVSLLEAMALGRPVISTNVGAIPELVEHKKHGWLISAGSVDELAIALREMLHTPVDILTEMGRQGRTAVIRRHDAGDEALKLASLITGKKRRLTAKRS
jgi:glycosyltransferase involved in cell wall biosynthesis